MKNSTSYKGPVLFASFWLVVLLASMSVCFLALHRSQLQG